MAAKVVPHLVVNNGEAAIAFYEKALGATLDMKMPSESGKLMHAALTLNGEQIFLVDDFPENEEDRGGAQAAPPRLGGTSVVIHLAVSDTDAAVKRAADAGAEVLMPAEDMFWGDRYAQIRDPFGHVWSFGAPVKQ